jgi:hypothetical protein
MYKRPIPRVVKVVDHPPPDLPGISRVTEILNKRDAPYVPNTNYRPIYQLNSLISGLRYRGVSEDKLDIIREKNKYTPPPPKKVKKPKKKVVIVEEEDIFVKYNPKTVKKKILKAVVKKI